MKHHNFSLSSVVSAALLATMSLLSSVYAQPMPSVQIDVQKAAAAQKQPLLDSLREFVNIETGSRDAEGITQATELLANKLRALGGQIQFIEPQEATNYLMADTPDKIGRMVKATFNGTGTKRIMLIAHIDTVYPKGMAAKQPFRIDGDKAYGLGISDDKQGVAMVVHVVAMLKAMNFSEYGTLTVFVNGDEEISSPGSRAELTKLGGEHDVVLSFEATRTQSDKLSLATSGIASVELKVEGRASHAGAAPERGVNALYELSHQILQMRDLSQNDKGLKLNWTVSQAGTNRNVIPAYATAQADVRVIKVADYDGIEATVREKAKTQLLPDAKVTVKFERRRPPLEATPANRKLAAHAQTIYAELGRKLEVDDQPEGGGTDAAFAALKTQAAVVERFGLQGFGGHTADNEYVLLETVEARLYLAARVVMDVARGKGL
jgi:glutamate carboxypeptidase